MRAENIVRERNPQSTAQIAGHPLHPMLIPFPVAFLVATLVCDLLFWNTGNSAWSTASLYLLGAALVMAALAAVAGLTDFRSIPVRTSSALGGSPRQRVTMTTATTMATVPIIVWRPMISPYRK